MNTLLLRRWHGYLGAFIAPTVIFFALTGALQLFRLNEAHDGYRPAPVVERLSRVHKDQVFAPGRRRGPPPGEGQVGPASGPRVPQDDAQAAIPTVLLKWFFLVVALALALSTTFGVLIGLTRPGGKSTTIALMIAGGAIPLVLLVV